MTSDRTHRLRAPHPAMRTATVAHRVAECLAGRLPAEALPAAERDRVVAQLVREGLSDVSIAARLRQTTYTTARIRERLGLAPNTVQHRRTAG